MPEREYVILVSIDKCRGNYFPYGNLNIPVVRTQIGDRMFGLVLNLSLIHKIADYLVTNKYIFTTAYISKELYNYYYGQHYSI